MTQFEITGMPLQETRAENLDRSKRTERVETSDLRIKTLGPCRFESPLVARLGRQALHQVGQVDRVLLDDRLSKVVESGASPTALPAFELAGPRDRIFFNPATLRCGIVACGGLCPGINNVIRGLVLELTHAYGVQEIWGLRYGSKEGVAARSPSMRRGPIVTRSRARWHGAWHSREARIPRENGVTRARRWNRALFVLR